MQAVAARGFTGQPRLEVKNKVLGSFSVIRRFLQLGLIEALVRLTREHLIEAADGLIADRKAVPQLPLLALNFANNPAFSCSKSRRRRMSARLAAATRWDSMCTSPKTRFTTASVVIGWVSMAQ